MRRSLSFVVIVSTLIMPLIMPLPAAAADRFADQPAGSWYVSGIVGGSFLAVASGGANTLAPADNFGTATGGVFTGGGALGLEMPLQSGAWRAEIEGRQRARLAGQTSFIGDPFVYDVHAADGWSVTANLWRDVAITERTDVYLGGGIGGGGYRLTVDDQVYAAGYSRVADFAWQAGGGLIWHPSDRIAIDLGYRFFAVGAGSTPLTDSLSGGPAGVYTSSLSASELVLTFRISEPFAALRARR